MTNIPAIITNTKTIETHFSDHKMIIAHHVTKTPIRTKRYITTRPYHEIIFDEMIREINNYSRLIQAMGSNDPNKISPNIIDTINHQLDFRAPIKRIQISKKKSTLQLEHNTYSTSEIQHGRKNN